MPGTLVHIATAPNDLQLSKLGLKGLIAPDFWKKQTPTESEYLQFFDDCPNAPSYEQVLLLCSIEHGGTHFGSAPSDTSHVDFTFLSTLFSSSRFDVENMFFKGYVHHLRVDKSFYADSSICNLIAFKKDSTVDRTTALANLHADWDKTNFAISKWYPEVIDIVATMPEKVRKVIGFTEGATKYVSLVPMHNFIEKMRKPRSLKELLLDSNF